MKPPDEIVLFEFGRHRIASLDFAPFLARFALDKLPENPRRLRGMMGSLLPCIHGYDEDARELYCIPEVRRFAREFHSIWPHWIFFFSAEPGTGAFEVFVACCLNHLNVVQRGDTGITILDSDPEEVTQFLLHDLPFFRQMCDRAKVFPELRRERVAEAFALFHLPVPEAAYGLM